MPFGRGHRRRVVAGLTMALAVVVASCGDDAVVDVTAGAARLTTTTTGVTTAPIASDNHEPIVSIDAPSSGQEFDAVYDTAMGRWGAPISFSATASDPDGDPITIAWSSDLDGPLGTGAAIGPVWLHIPYDSGYPVITVTVTDQWGVSATAHIVILIFKPSDT